MIGERMERTKRIKTDCSHLLRFLYWTTKQSVHIRSIRFVRFQSINTSSIIKKSQKNIFSYSKTKIKTPFEFVFVLEFEFIDLLAWRRWWQHHPCQTKSWTINKKMFRTNLFTPKHDWRTDKLLTALLGVRYSSSATIALYFIGSNLMIHSIPNLSLNIPK